MQTRARPPTLSLRPCANWVQLVQAAMYQPAPDNNPPMHPVHVNINLALTAIIEQPAYRPFVRYSEKFKKQWDEMVHPGDRDSYGNQELNGDCLVLVAAERCITKLNPRLNEEQRAKFSDAIVSNKVFWALLMRMGVCCWPFEKVLANAFEIFCALLDSCDPLEAHGWMVRLFVPLLKRMMGISANPCIEYTVKIYPLSFPVTEPAPYRIPFGAISNRPPYTLLSTSTGTEEKTHRLSGNENRHCPDAKTERGIRLLILCDVMWPASRSFFSTMGLPSAPLAAHQRTRSSCSKSLLGHPAQANAPFNTVQVHGLPSNLRRAIPRLHPAREPAQKLGERLLHGPPTALFSRSTLQARVSVELRCLLKKVEPSKAAGISDEGWSCMKRDIRSGISLAAPRVPQADLTVRPAYMLDWTPILTIASNTSMLPSRTSVLSCGWPEPCAFHSTGD
uniref:Uncharacterized protein n=1 Tax=Mycena chlorophos TaxID=658473 RepID=A0ABQ0LV95_MYCCL|nr:predicted protein [Mycena chlorophos]